MSTESTKDADWRCLACLVRQWLDPRIPVGLQIVWWPIWRKATWVPLAHFTRFEEGGYSVIYKWAVMLGPLEIRRWK